MGILRKEFPVLPGVNESRRSRNPSGSDLMPWALLLGSGLVQTKKGSFVVGYYAMPPDTVGSTHEWQAQISNRIQIALSKFGAGWATWTDVASIEAPPYPSREESFFPDPVSAMIDEERRREFEAEGEHFDNHRTFGICYTPPHQQVSKLESLMYTGGGAETETPMARLLEGFRKALDSFEDECANVIGLRRMVSFPHVDQFGRRHLYDELVNYLYYCATGHTQWVEIPEYGAYLDCLIGSQEFEVGEIPRIGDELIHVVSIDGFPAESFPNITAALNSMAIPYHFSQRAIYMDEIEAEQVAKRYSRQWSSKVTSLMSKLTNSKGAPVDDYAAGMVKDANVADSLAKAGVRYLYYSAVVVLRHHDPVVLRDWARMVSRTIRGCHFSPRIEETNTIEAWRGSMWGDVRSNIRVFPVHTGNLADMLPLSGIWTGDATAPNPMYPEGSPPMMFGRTNGGIPFRMNVHVDDTGHTVMLGPTGVGKSSTANSMALQGLRYPEMRITSFDFKMGMYVPAMACGGNHYNIGADQEPLLCPLSDLETVQDRLEAEEYIALLFLMQHQRLPSPHQRIEITLAVDRLSRRKNRSLSHFITACSDLEVKSAVNFYTVKGSAGHLLDATADRVKLSHFNVYEIRPLMAMSDAIKIPTLDIMFRKFERTLDGRPTLLFVSEAWMAFSHPIWSDKIEGWLRLLRSKNCAMIMDTQSLADAVKSSIMGVLIENCPTKLYLPNPDARKTGTPEHPGPYDLYRMMGLNDNQIDIIRGATRKQDIYWTSSKGARLTALDLPPLQKSIVAATSETDVRLVQSLVAEYGDDWTRVYWDKLGVEYADLRRAI